MKKIDKDSPVPLYYQLKDIIRDMIENEELKPDEPVPPERVLCEMHGVSRMTVNKAIINLVNEGLLYREQGRGTFVAGPKKDYKVTGLTGLTEEMVKKGLKVDTKILSFRKMDPSKKMKSIFNISDGKIYEIERLRNVEDEPYALEFSYIPCILCEGLNREMLEGQSLYSVLEKKYSLKMKYATQTIEPIILDDFETNILQCESTLALLFLRTTYTKDDVPMEYTKSLYRSDRYKFEIMLRR